MKRLIIMLTLLVICLVPSVAQAAAATASDAVVQIGQDVVVSADQTVDEVVVINADAHIAGRVIGNVLAVNGTIYLESGANVGGNTATLAGKVVNNGSEIISGTRIDLGNSINLSTLNQLRHLSVRPSWFSHLWSATSWWQLLTIILLGLLVNWMCPRPLQRTADALTADPAKSALYGVLAYLALIPLTLVLVITILGIPAIPVLWGGVALARLLGQVALGLVAGRYLIAQLRNSSLTEYVLPIGLLTLGLITMLPVVGGLASLFYGIVGFGAAVWTKFGTHPAFNN